MQLPMPLALPLCCAGAGHGAQPGAHHGAGGRGAGGRCAGASVCGCVLCGCVYVFCRLMWVGWGHGRASSWARDGEAGRQPGVTGQVLAARPAQLVELAPCREGPGNQQGHRVWMRARPPLQFSLPPPPTPSLLPTPAPQACCAPAALIPLPANHLLVCCRPCFVALSPPLPADQLRLAVAEAICRTAKRRNEFSNAVIAIEAEDRLPKWVGWGLQA